MYCDIVCTLRVTLCSQLCPCVTVLNSCHCCCMLDVAYCVLGLACPKVRGAGSLHVWHDPLPEGMQPQVPSCSELWLLMVTTIAMQQLEAAVRMSGNLVFVVGWAVRNDQSNAVSHSFVVFVFVFLFVCLSLWHLLKLSTAAGRVRFSHSGCLCFVFVCLFVCLVVSFVK